MMDFRRMTQIWRCIDSYCDALSRRSMECYLMTLKGSRCHNMFISIHDLEMSSSMYSQAKSSVRLLLERDRKVEMSKYSINVSRYVLTKTSKATTVHPT